MPVVKIIGGEVVAVFRDVADVAAALAKYPALAGAHLEAGDHPPGMRYKAGKFTPPAEPELERGLTAKQIRAALAADLARRRWQIEVGGVEVGGAMVRSDPASLSRLKNALDFLRAGILSAPVKIKTASGFVDVDEPQLAAMVAAVAQHVQAAYDREAELAALVEAGQIKTLADLRVGWKARGPA